jgi:serine O-acetyltransferase
VVVGAGAKILGAVAIGDDVRVGANSVVLHGVPANSTVVGIPGRVVRRRLHDDNNVLAHGELPDPIMDAMAGLEARIRKLEKKSGKR